MSRWITYSLLRLGLFTGLFVLLMVLGIEWWVSALLATAIAFTISYIFFYRQRAELAKDMERLVARQKDKDPDAQAEDGIPLEGDSPRQSTGEE
jgi:hypothetical protein